jgi:hypothetical protein
MKKWKIAIPVVVVALFIAWYAFRPERLVVNRPVDEPFPTVNADSSAQALASGNFYSILHPTAGTATIYRLGTVVAFFASRTSKRPTVLTFTSTWWPPRTRKTTPQWNALLY